MALAVWWCVHIISAFSPARRAGTDEAHVAPIAQVGTDTTRCALYVSCASLHSQTLVRSSPANAMMFLFRLGVLFYAIAFVSQLM